MKIIRAVLRIKLFGTPVFATAAGSFLLLSTMWIWFGGLFVHAYQPLMGITEEQVSAESLGIWYPLGVLFCYVQGSGIATVLKWRNWPNVLNAAKTGATVALLLCAMVFTYPLVILPEHSITLFLINSSGLVIAWTLAASIISFFYRASLKFRLHFY